MHQEREIAKHQVRMRVLESMALADLGANYHSLSPGDRHHKSACAEISGTSCRSQSTEEALRLLSSFRQRIWPGYVRVKPASLRFWKNLLLVLTFVWSATWKLPVNRASTSGWR